MNRDYKAPRLGASWRIARDVAMNEGRGALYRGLAPNLVGNMASWSMYFMLYVYFLAPCSLSLGKLLYVINIVKTNYSFKKTLFFKWSPVLITML